MAKIDAFEKCLTPPVKMSSYQQGKIYKITSPNTDKVYIGSTTLTLDKRFQCHVSASKDPYIHTTSEIVIKAGDAKIELIEVFPCDSKAQLELREGEIQKVTIDCCNKVVAGERTIEEKAAQQRDYYVANKDAIAVQRQEYRAANKDEIAETNKKYKIAHAEEIAEYKKMYAIAHAEELAEYKKMYAIAHAEELAEYRKKHYVANRDAIREQQRQYRLQKKADAALAQNLPDT